jgi:amidophosphoribosyltransferase
VVQGHDLIIVEDSIVRGTTTREKIRDLRSVGAKSIHMRVCSPPLRHKCFYGIDIPTDRELIAHHHDEAEIRGFIGADTLKYQALEDLLRSVPGGEYCHACMSGEYPIK